jgi:hypothetical protein
MTEAISDAQQELAGAMREANAATSTETPKATSPETEAISSTPQEISGALEEANSSTPAETPKATSPEKED